MMRILLLLLGLCGMGLAMPAAAQRSPAQATPPPQAAGLSADQARIALDVLNDPRKRAAFAATLDAIIKAGPGAQPTSSPQASPSAGPGGGSGGGSGAAGGDRQPPRPIASPAQAAPAGAASAPSASGTVNGTAGGDSQAGRDDAGVIPLSADSLGAQVLITASDFVNQLGSQVTEAFEAVQSLPLLWGWAVAMVTHPVARAILADASWRLLAALLTAIAVEYALRRMMRRPIARLEAMAPASAGETLEPLAPDDAAASGDDNSASGDDNSVSGDDQTTSGGDRASAEAGKPTAAGRKTSYRDDEADLPTGADAPAHPTAARTAVADAHDRAEAGEVEPPIVTRRRASPWLLLRRVPLVLARLMLELVPVLGVTVTAHLIAGSSLGGQRTSQLIILAVVDSYAICAAVLCVSRMMLSPDASRLRLFHVPNSAAVYLTRWVRRLAVIAVFGYAFGEVGLLLGLSSVSYDAVQKTVALILHLCLATMVMQKRRAVRRRIRAPDGVTGPVAMLRNRLAQSWHWIALFLLAGGWVTLAVEARNGYTQVLRYVLMTALVLIGSHLIQLLLLGLVERAVRTSGESAATFPGLEARLRIYLPAVNTIVRIVITILTVLILLQLYGIGALDWLVSSFLGLRILSALGTFAVTLVLAFGVWEAVNAGIQHHLAKLQRDAQLARSARIRTLLPLLRTTLMVLIATITALMALSEIGVNIAPLLAGAGILGVAIGFGSQKLVQDLITGVFLLLENAMQVGDWVTVSGLSGSVEALSVRTIRLRAADGSVHIIPFSAVTSVTNVNRGLGNAAVAVTVDFTEDTDQVVDALKAISREMRAHADFSARMLGDVTIFGVDRFDGAGVTVTGQVVCTDSGRWSVQREFNRRIKMRFQELGIGIFNPLRTYTVTVPASPPEMNREDGAYGPSDGAVPNGGATTGGATTGTRQAVGETGGGQTRTDQPVGGLGRAVG